MPPKRPYRKKTTRRRYNKKRSMPRVSRPLKQRVIGFKRNFTLPVVALENPDTWADPNPLKWVRGGNTNPLNSVVGTLVFSLNQLPGYSEYKNLFHMYKLNAVVMKIYTTSSSITSQNINGPLQTGSIGVSNFTIETWKNQTGQPYASNTFTDELMNQIPAVKRRMMPRGKPYTIVCKLNQLSATYREQYTEGTVTDTAGNDIQVVKPYNIDYGVRKARYLSTQEDGCPHYGLNIRFRKLDDSDFDILSPRLKIHYTLYFTCKGLK